jgi:hypothetical protein
MLYLKLLVHGPLAKKPHQKILNIAYLRGSSVREPDAQDTSLSDWLFYNKTPR